MPGFSLWTLVLATFCAVSASGCGGGSSGPQGNSSFTAQVLWEQIDDTHSTSPARGLAEEAQRGFGPTIPRLVRTVRIIVRPAHGDDCCLAIERTDPAFEERLVVVRGLPAGRATVRVTGFATVGAPPEEEATELCATDPPGVGSLCSAPLSAPPFDSDPVSVDLIEGQRTDAGDIEVFAIPFILEEEWNPAPNGSIERLQRATFTVVDARSGIDASSIALRITQGSETVFPVLDRTPCDDDAGTTPCSIGGTLGVRGYRVASEPLPHTLTIGLAEFGITASNLEVPPEALRLQPYSVNIASEPATPTPTPTLTVTPTPSLTPAATPTLVPTATPTCAPAAQSCDVLPCCAGPVFSNGEDVCVFDDTQNRNICTCLGAGRGDFQVSCASDRECCSGRCDPDPFNPENRLCACGRAGTPCETSTDCCSLVCDRNETERYGRCVGSTLACVQAFPDMCGQGNCPTGQSCELQDPTLCSCCTNPEVTCEVDAECCPGRSPQGGTVASACSGGTCCLGPGAGCASASECCPGTLVSPSPGATPVPSRCLDGGGGSVCCLGVGSQCEVDSECCGGTCCFGACDTDPTCGIG